MLDKNTLSQLSKLKAEIHAAREFATGTVASTTGRFGFVRLEDGRDAYVTPEKMQHVLPGDLVKIEVLTNAEGKIEAKLEKLIRSDLQRFVGRYRTKGNAHFVEPVDAHVNRWIFVPPKARMGAQEGQIVVARVTQHPWKDAKAQAKVLDIIGKEDEAWYDFRFTCAKYALNLPLARKTEEQLKQIRENASDLSKLSRPSLEDLDFVTIDAATTRDMDDALAIQKTENGYTLFVAIADPSSFIALDSALAQHAERKAQTLYLNGGVLPMLDDELANTVFSLQAGEKRPALVCSIELDETTKVSQYDFQFALVQSRHKLSYENLADWLESGNCTELPADIFKQLQTLQAFAQTRNALRQQENLVGDDQNDYSLQLDDKGKIAAIVPRKKTIAHLLVEECMLLVNCCAGDLLAQHQTGLHTTHEGFRSDRIGEVRALLKEEELADEEIEKLDTYCDLLRTVSANENKRYLLPALRRMSDNAKISNKSEAHFGMGFAHYATVSSPLRRFADLFNHWCIAAILENGTLPVMDDERLEKLNESIQNGRQADRELRQTLIVEYAKTLIGMEAEAQIRIVTPQGFGARFAENGIDGFVLFDKKTEKSFDAKRLTMTAGDQVWKIGDTVKVRLASCDLQKKRIAFELSGK